MWLHRFNSLCLVQLALSLREQGESLFSTLDVDEVQVPCPAATPSDDSRLDFVLDSKYAGPFNSFSNYSLHRTADCNGRIEDVPLTLFTMRNINKPSENDLSIVVGDELLLYPNMPMPLYVCGVTYLLVGKVECLCRISIRGMNHIKPLRRVLLEMPLEKLNVLPEGFMVAIVSFFQSKLSPQSAGAVKTEKTVSIRHTRLTLLRFLEDVDQTYGFVCPGALSCFDILYMLMLVGILVLSISLLLSCRRLPEVWEKENPEVTRTLKIHGPEQLCRAWSLQIAAFVGFVLILQGIAIRFVTDGWLLPIIIGFTMLVGLLELFHMFQTFCRLQLLNAALSQGLHISFASSFAGGVSTFVVNVGLALSILATALLVLFGAAYHNLSLLYAASMAVWPAILGICKVLVFLKEKDGELEQSIVPAFIAAIYKPRLDQRERNSFNKMSGAVFLKWCRQTRRPSCPSSPGQIPGSDEDDSDTFELYRDLGWHGHAIFKLTGSRVALLNPLLLLLMVVFIVGVSSARFAITLCTPPALLDFQPEAGQLIPHFRKGRRRFAWLHPISLERGKATFTPVKSASVEFSEPVKGPGPFWKQTDENPITHWMVRANQLGFKQKTYTIYDVPVEVVPTTLRLRFGAYDRCLWFSMMKNSNKGSVPISVPEDLNSSQLEVSVSFRQVALSGASAGESGLFGTVCKNHTVLKAPSKAAKTSTSAWSNSAVVPCEEACRREPRCIVSQDFGRYCCFKWIHGFRQEASICESENAAQALSKRLLFGADANGTSLRGWAGLFSWNGGIRNKTGEEIIEDGVSTIRWDFDWQNLSLGSRELELSQLGIPEGQEFGAYLNITSGTPSIQGAVAVLESNADDEVQVRVHINGSGALLVELEPNMETFRFSRGGFWRKLHILPLLADHSLEYDLECQQTHRCKEEAEENRSFCQLQRCTHLHSNEMLLELFQQSCEQELARWYDICGGPFSTQVLSLDINLLEQFTLAGRIALKPVDTRFKQKFTDVIVQSRFMSHGIRGQLFHEDACAVPIPTEEMTRVALACSIFEANCPNITLRDGNNPSVVPVLPTARGSVLERLVQANLTGSHFAQIAFCAVEHSSFGKNGGAKLIEGKVNVENLLEADQAGAVIGAKGRTLMREQMHNMLHEDANGVPGVVAAAIVEHATNDALQALFQGMLDKFPDMICDVHQKLGRQLVLKAIKMLDLGEANLAKRFLQAMQGVNDTVYECFCNYILAEYVKNGAQRIFGSSLRKLSNSSYYPTRLSLKPRALNKGGRMVLPRIVWKRMADVFNQFLLLHSFEIYNADLLPILKFLLELPQNITHLSFPGANLSAAAKDATAWREELRRIRTVQNSVATFGATQLGRPRPFQRLMDLNLSRPDLHSPAQLSGYLDLIAAFWQLNLTNLDISGWLVSNSWKLLKHAADFTQTLQPQTSIREATFSCKVEEDEDYSEESHHKTSCNCHSRILIDILEKLPLLESLHVTLELDTSKAIINHDLEYDEDYQRYVPVQTREKACDNSEGLRSLARALSHHGSIRSLHLHNWAYRLLYEVPNPTNFTKVRVEDPTWPTRTTHTAGGWNQVSQSMRNETLEKLQSMGFPDLEIREGGKKVSL